MSKGRGGRSGVERAGKSQVLRGLAGHGDGVWLSFKCSVLSQYQIDIPTIEHEQVTRKLQNSGMSFSSDHNLLQHNIFHASL